MSYSGSAERTNTRAAGDGKIGRVPGTPGAEVDEHEDQPIWTSRQAALRVLQRSAEQMTQAMRDALQPPPSEAEVSARETDGQLDVYA
jgi:hypothetical protein